MRRNTKSDKEPEGMDPSITEDRVGAPATNTKRACYAIRTLVNEVLELFPETPVEYSNYDGRNTALDVTFDLTALDEDERSTLTSLLVLLDDPAYNDDSRIDCVISHEDTVLVSMKPNARTQDSRESFGLADALDILSEPGESA